MFIQKKKQPMINGQKYIEQNSSFHPNRNISLSYFKVGTIDKDHLSIIMKNLAENTSYVFKIVNQSSSDEENNVTQQFNFEIASGLLNIFFPIKENSIDHFS